MTAKEKAAQSAKKRYVVTTTCYFNAHYYKKGELVELSALIKPPTHFLLIEAKKESVADSKKGLTQ